MMKVLKLAIIVILMLYTGTVGAQVSVNINIGSPPPWGPVGYVDVRYYYLPDIEAYYDVQTSMFIYFGGGVWMHRRNLPMRYRNYDLYNGYKVVMTDYRGNTPYKNFGKHRSMYAKGYHGKAQKTVGENHGRGKSGSNIMHNKGSSGKELSGKGKRSNSLNNQHMQGKKGHGGGNRKK